MTFFVRFFIVVLVTFLLSLSCQKKEVTNVNSSHDSIEKYRSLFQNSDLPIKQRIDYADKLVSLVQKAPNDSVTRNYFFYVLSFYSNNSKFENVKNNCACCNIKLLY
jgi:hypothetical protein